MKRMKVRSRHKISHEGITKILIRSTNWVGDTVMMIPSVAAIRKSFPHAQITVLATPWVMPLLQNHPAVDRTMIMEKSGGFLASFRELARIISWLRGERFDLGILFQNAFEAGFLAYMGGVRHIVGYGTDGRGFFLTHKVIRDRGILSVHQAEYFLGLIEAMGWEAQEREPSLHIHDEDIKSSSLMLSTMGIDDSLFVVGLNPGAEYGSAKRWPEERFATLGDWAAKKWAAKVVLFGSPSEREIAARVSHHMHSNPVNLCGRTTLGQVMALIKRCDLFLTNDTGLMHVAAAFRVPIVAIFGSTDPVATGPISRNVRIVRHSIDCSPCLREVCPTDHRCMLSIEPEEVWEKMEDLKRELKI
jgi:heptosyltransferase-2